MVFEMFGWWYARGWAGCAQGILEKMKGIADRFSIGLLFQTLFQPFRQISAMRPENVSLGDRIRLFFDRLVSRIIGAFVRLILIFTGTVALILSAIIGAVVLVIWPLVPLALPASLVLAIIGVTF